MESFFKNVVAVFDILDGGTGVGTFDEHDSEGYLVLGLVFQSVSLFGKRIETPSGDDKGFDFPARSAGQYVRAGIKYANLVIGPEIAVDPDINFQDPRVPIQRCARDHDVIAEVQGHGFQIVGFGIAGHPIDLVLVDLHGEEVADRPAVIEGSARLILDFAPIKRGHLPSGRSLKGGEDKTAGDRIRKKDHTGYSHSP